MKKKFILCIILLSIVITGCKNINSSNEKDDIVEEIANLFKDDSNDYIINNLDDNVLNGERYEINFNDDFLLNVYVYSSEEDAITDANYLSDDGYEYKKTYKENSITTIIDWISPPHFFQYKNSIVLYLGDNQDVLGQLSNNLGEQIAGK